MRISYSKNAGLVLDADLALVVVDGELLRHVLQVGRGVSQTRI